LKRAAEEVLADGTFTYAADAIPDRGVSQLMSGEKLENRRLQGKRT
jgi:hypothetical protein